MERLLFSLRGLTRLDKNSFTVVRHQLELTSKVQILKRTWAPWMEGVAVFSELSDVDAINADPESLSRISVPMWSLLPLIDSTFLSQENNVNPRQTNADVIKALFAQYTQSISKAGYNRLYNYLTEERDAYLAGYLCVRMVLACWRHSADFDITGSDATFLLNFLTSEIDRHAIPGFAENGLAFEQKALQLHMAWLVACCSLSRDDLLTILAASGRDTADSLLSLALVDGRFALSRRSLDEE